MNYTPPFFLRNGHLNTVYPTLFRRQSEPPYQRRELTTEDGDFIHVDCLLNGSGRLAILCHGLEGSSRSKYIIGAAELMSANGWDVAAINYRSCSGPMNRKLRMYHSGATEDLELAIHHFSEFYGQIVLVGFSLGGNLVLKYAGEKGWNLDERISSVIAVSVPVDLKGGSLHIGRKQNFVYERKFLKTLKEKMQIKAKAFPRDIDVERLDGIESLYDFDDVYTGPIHGFRDADDYYEQCSSKYFIANIQRRAHIINAQDDPFLPESCYPFEQASRNPNINLMTPRYGGHVGFVRFMRRHYWIENQILRLAELQKKA